MDDQKKRNQVSFRPQALKEWQALPDDVRKRLKDKLKERIENGHPPKARLNGSTYKVKLKQPPYRLIYDVLNDGTVSIDVVIIGTRDKVYKELRRRLARN